MLYEDVDVKVNTSGTAGKYPCNGCMNGHMHVGQYNIHYYTAGDKQDVCYEDIDVKVNATAAASKLN